MASGWSSSPTVARWPGAAVALAAEMLHGRPQRIEVAAGLDETTFGTDAVGIMEAIERADGRRRRRRTHGPRQRRAERRAGARPAARPFDPGPRDSLAGPDRRGPHRRCGGGCGWGRPGRGRGRGSRRADGQGLAPVSAGSRRPRGCRRGRRGGGHRSLRGREPARAARPTRRPPRQRGACPRRVGPAAQPHHRRRTGPGREPEPSRDVGSPVGARGRGSRLRPPGTGGRRASRRARGAPVRRNSRGGGGHVDSALDGSANGSASRLAGDRDRPGSPVDRRTRRRRAVPDRRAGRGMATHRGVGGRRTARDRAGPRRHRATGGCRAGKHLRRTSLAAHRRRDARRRQGPRRHGHRGGGRLGGLPGRRRTRVGRPARPLPARAGRGRPRGRRPGAARVDGRTRPTDHRGGSPGGRRPDSRRDGRPGSRPGDRSGARPWQPDLARRHPGPGPRHPRCRGCRHRGVEHPRRHYGRPRWRQRRAALRSVAGADWGSTGVAPRSSPTNATVSSLSPRTRPCPATARPSSWPPTSDR